MDNCIYRGHVRHRRYEPVVRDFRYPIAYLFVNLDDLENVVKRIPLLGLQHSLFAIRRSDHLGDDSEALSSAIRSELKRPSGRPAEGSIFLLTFWSTLGYYFNPISLFVHFDEAGQMDRVLAEVSNTPWGERHTYVLGDHNRAPGSLQSFAHEKEFHVSPFLDLGLKYFWSVSEPKDRWSIHLAVSKPADQDLNEEQTGRHRQHEGIRYVDQFDATLSLSRRPLTNMNWLRTVSRFPVPPLQTITAIYFQALKLWIQRVPFYPHPSKRSSTKDAAVS